MPGLMMSACNGGRDWLKWKYFLFWENNQGGFWGEGLGYLGNSWIGTKRLINSNGESGTIYNEAACTRVEMRIWEAQEHWNHVIPLLNFCCFIRICCTFSSNYFSTFLEESKHWWINKKSFQDARTCSLSASSASSVKYILPIISPSSQLR